MTSNEQDCLARLKDLQLGLQKQLGSASKGIQDLAQAPITAELLHDIQCCIESENVAAIRMGFYTLKGLFLERSFFSAPESFQRTLIQRIEQLLESTSDAVVMDAVEWFAMLRTCFSGYRGQMLRFLKSEKEGVRKLALLYYDTFSYPGEVEPLLHFRYDGYVTELSPLGEWEYSLRNKALETVEKKVGKKFPRECRVEPYNGAQVKWYDWKPFIEWWMQHGTEFARRTHA